MAQELGAAIGVDPSHLCRAEARERNLSVDALVAAATGLGCDVSVRLFRTTGPRVRDHIQVRMIETLLSVLDPRWIARLEVPVYRPTRGVIDVVLQDRVYGDLVAGEGHSALHVVERQLRWAGVKADALTSASGWPWSEEEDAPPPGRLLLLRACAANRELARAVPRTFAAAYPARSADAVAALTTADRRWPGSAIVWVDVDGAATRLMAEGPRGL